jgi:DUF971 family protein
MLKPQKIEFINPFDFRIVWSDGHESIYQSYSLRLECPCATCVHEFTKEKLLKPENISKDVHPVAFHYVGKYALLIKWDNGHDTGYYTFDHLRSLCRCQVCTKSSNPGS